MEATKNTLRQVIISKRLKLGSSFAEIRSKIETDSKYAGLKNLCRFRPEENELAYRTEKIYPNRCEHPKRIPILFLFSNPHPDSVACGLFLSEPHSRSFWQRLSEINKDYLQFPQGAVNLEHWEESILKLREIMLKGDYKSPFLLYFHCLYPIPTSKPKDLRGLFKSAPHIWKEIKVSSNRELFKLTKNEQIKHIVVFNVGVFRTITKTKVKGWGKKDAAEEFLKSGNKERYWGVDSNGAHIYLSLHTRAKNWKDGKGQYYFTRFLDLIFTRIKETI
jgi:hypothetical protein